MKKALILTVSLLALALLIFSPGYDGYSISGTDPGKLIRFHVVANSDSLADQALKIKVRDRVLEEMSPALAGITDVEQARLVINGHLGQISSMAADVVSQYGYDYGVTAYLGQFDFPEKTYIIKSGIGGSSKQGYITLPAGNYQAVRIVLGSGSGANWWCVLFPPLCFVSPAVVTAGGQQDQEYSPGLNPSGGYLLGENNKLNYPEDRSGPEISAAAFSGRQAEYRFKILELLQRFYN